MGVPNSNCTIIFQWTLFNKFSFFFLHEKNRFSYLKYLRDSINYADMFRNGYQETMKKNINAQLWKHILRINCSSFMTGIDSTENIMSIECPCFICPVLQCSALSVNRDKSLRRKLGLGWISLLQLKYKFWAGYKKINPINSYLCPNY